MRLLYADADGNLYDHPTLRAAGRTGDRYCDPAPEDLIEMPAGASLVLIPGGHPVGITARGRFSLVEREYRGEGPAFAVGALLPQGYTRTLLPAYRRRKGDRPLPLLGYAAAAWRRGKVYVAAVKTDSPERWDPKHYNTPDLPSLVEGLKGEMPANRIVRQLAGCALEYACFTAQNIFYGRWEGGIPVSTSCNARCLGCISLQPAECCPAPQSRITFTPSVNEVAELCYRHLAVSGGDIISFGQGCEGEPTMAAGLIKEALKLIRRKTLRGTINMNTNAGNTPAIETLCGAGLDSIRVSLISGREEIYNRYYRPRGYGLDDVRESLKRAGRMGVYASLNLLVYPGLTDREEESEALAALIRETGVRLVQLRNLNIDPDFLFENTPPAEGDIIGITGLISRLKTIPGLEVGNFSRPLR
ncbi:MAG: radical SAM protein [Bacillota bacterium]